jgi:imidazolonepropionase-like amidohydrolase
MNMTRTDFNDNVLLAGARLVLPERVLENGSLIVEGGRIARVVGGEAPPGARVLDLEGLTVYPGFIDVHVHGALGVDTLEASSEDLFRVALYLAGEGVTAWLDRGAVLAADFTTRPGAAPALPAPRTRARVPPGRESRR